jgi:acyl-CoA reductase-like NAD-dependent aldehyde dehydrogenase
MRPLLVLVDLQNDFLDAPALEPPRSEVIRRSARLLAAAREAGVPVVHCVTTVDRERDGRMPHWKEAGRWSCVRGTPGHAPPPELAPRAGETVVDKTFFSGFSAAGPAALDAAIAAAGADALVLSGVHLHGCVRATALDAYARGLEVWIAEDATGSDDPLHAAVTRRYLDGRAARFAAVAELARRFRGAGVAGELIHFSPRETSRALFTVAQGGAADAARATAAARGAREEWSALAHAGRARALERLAALFEADADSLAREMAVDVGKPVAQGRAETLRAAELVRRAAAAPPSDSAASGSGSAWRRVPLGVVAAITPWNNPIAIPWGKLAPALAAGNAAIWKPAPAATRLALRTLALAREAGLPDGLVGVVTGDQRAAAAVMSDPGVDAVSISGSSLAGWAAQEACARRRIPLQAELGGNNGAIVWSGADLAAAAREIARGAFSFAGQRCTANRRVVVEAGRRDEFLGLLQAATARLKWADPLDPATDVGPVLSVDARDRVEAALERAAASGANVLRPHGPRPLPAAPAEGAYCAAAVVWGVTHASEIVQEETFGPVVVVEEAPSFDEALALAGGVRQGLVAALFAGPGPWRDRFLSETRAGILKWNASTADADAAAPFGGWKASGVGPPEHGPGNAEFYGRLQAVYGVPVELADLAREVEAGREP